MIYPQGIWYGRVGLADVPRIVEETVVHGRILEDLLIPDVLLNCRGLASRATKEPGQPLSRSPLRLTATVATYPS